MSDYKFEAGKKYNIKLHYECKHHDENPHQYIINDGDIIIFRNKYGHLMEIKKSDIAEITEHRELLKKTETKYVVFDPDRPPEYGRYIDTVCDLSTNGYFYTSKSEAMDALDLDYSKIAKIEIMVTEELQEPKE